MKTPGKNPSDLGTPEIGRRLKVRAELSATYRARARVLNDCPIDAMMYRGQIKPTHHHALTMVRRDYETASLHGYKPTKFMWVSPSRGEHDRCAVALLRLQGSLVWVGRSRPSYPARLWRLAIDEQPIAPAVALKIAAALASFYGKWGSALDEPDPEFLRRLFLRPSPG